MTFKSLSPFIPSGKDFEQSKKLFIELGFKINWNAGDYTGFERDNCTFILQRFDDKHFAENLMISVSVSSADEFWNEVNTKELAKKFGARFSAPTKQPYGIEVNMIDLAGVCWHFVEG
jgi:predicted lactoylglutathione lyase